MHTTHTHQNSIPINYYKTSEEQRIPGKSIKI